MIVDKVCLIELILKDRLQKISKSIIGRDL